MSTGLHGYRGKALEILEKANASIGDTVRITLDDGMIEGLVMPRTELGDPNHIVIKLANGYNIGVEVDRKTRVEVTRHSEKTPETVTAQGLPERKDLPLVTILGTGGTIASRVEYRTGAVFPSLSAEDLYLAVPELADIARIRTKVLFNIFSESMTPKHWSQIAEAVANQIEEGAEGIIVAHGTDTMGYTAAALSFALQNLPVPVILVGSQRSSDRPSSDAASNLMAAAITAAHAPFSEVVVAMHEWVSDEAVALHRGTKVRKCHTSRRDAFKSINTQPLAKVIEGRVVMATEDYKHRDSRRKLMLEPHFKENVALVKFYPGFNPEMIDFLVDREYNGIILEGTGLGHVNRDCLNSIERAVNSGIVVGMTSQCIWGEVRMTVYDTGRDLLAKGVIPLGDMLPETAVVKLMWALGKETQPDKVKDLMLSNIAGERSLRIQI